MKIQSKGMFFLLLAVAQFAFLPIALKVGGSDLGSVRFLLYSFIVATIATALLVIFTGRSRKFTELLTQRKTVTVLVIGGLLNYAISSTLLTIGTVHTTASLGGVIFRSWALFMIPFIPLILKTKVNKYQILSLGLGFVAVYVALTQGSIISINAAYAPYIIILLLSAVCAALSNLLIKSQNADLYSQLLLFNISALVFFAIAAAATGQLAIVAVTPAALLSILFIGSITYTVGAAFYFYALKVFDPTFVGNAMLVVPFLTFFFAWIILGEAVYPYYLLLGIIVVAGILIQRLSPAKAPERVARKNSRNSAVFDLTSAFVDNKNEVFYNCIKGSGRALGVSGSIGDIYEKMNVKERKTLEDKYNCVLFTNMNPHSAVMQEELDFIHSVLGKKADEPVLIGLGNPIDVEKAMDEIASTTSFENRDK